MFNKLSVLILASPAELTFRTPATEFDCIDTCPQVPACKLSVLEIKSPPMICKLSLSVRVFVPMSMVPLAALKVPPRALMARLFVRFATAILPITAEIVPWLRIVLVCMLTLPVIACMTAAGPVAPIVLGCTLAITGAFMDKEPALIMLPAL